MKNIKVLTVAKMSDYFGMLSAQNDLCPLKSLTLERDFSGCSHTSTNFSIAYTMG